jgi:peptidoglycan/LPS O-acetylase OafA/YrhL
MRRFRAGVLAVLVCVALLVAGAVLYGGGHHRLGGAILALALIGLGLVIAPAMSAEGRSAEAQGMLGRRSHIGGFDRPRDESGL